MDNHKFRITGRVVDRTEQGAEDLIIEVWDKDLFFDDLVGSAETDAEGFFEIRFNEDYFKEIIHRKPDLFFKVRYEDRFIPGAELKIEVKLPTGEILTGTGESVFWKVSPGETNVSIKLAIPTASQIFKVKGTILQPDGTPVVGTTVKAFDKDLRHEEELGEVFTNQVGKYEITYTRDHFQRAEKRSADLVVRVYDPDVPDLLTGESEVIFNAAQSETIDITIGLHLSEYEQYMQIIDQVREEVAVGDLTESDIAFLHGETAISVQRLRFVIAADHLGRQTQLDPAVFYGLARHDFPTELSNLVARNFWEIRQALERSLDTGIIPEHLRTELDPIIEQLKTFAPDPVDISPFQPIEVQKTNLGLVANLALLDASKVALLQARFSSLVTLNDRALNSLVESQDLNENEAKEVGLCASLYHLVDENVALVETLRNWNFPMLAGGRIQEIKNLIFLTRADWQALLTAADVMPPDAKTTEQYAVHLSRKIENLYPTDVLLQRLVSKKPNKIAADLNALQPLIEKNQGAFGTGDFRRLNVTGISGKDALRNRYDSLRRLANAYPGLNLVEVLDNHEHSAQARSMQIVNRIELLMLFQANNPDVELLHLDYAGGSAEVEELNFNGLSDEDKAMVLANVKAGQRIYTLAKDIEHTRIMLEAGYHASSDIVKDGHAAFQANTGLDEHTAAAYYNEALEAVGNTTATVATLFDGLWGGLDWTDVGNIGPFIEDYFKSIDGYDELFGRQDFCRCEHCQSILSPAAYFVDLMHFIQTSVIPDEFHETHNEHVLYLKVRRPDLWELPLTCENTHTEISQLVIVNEIFENYIARKEGYDGLLEDREAVNNAVYGQCLHEAQCSFGQPFTLPLETLQIYLEHFKVTREEIARLLEEAPAVVAIARFGLSEKAYNLITQPDDRLNFLRKLYGIPFEINDITGKIEAFDAQRLLVPMHLDRDQLGELVKTNFATAEGAEPVTIIGEKTDENSVQNDIERIYGLTLGALDRMHRLTRLWKRLAWSIRELDLVLSHLDARGLSNGIEPDTLDRLADILPIQKRFETTVEVLCALWSGLPTTIVTEDRASYFDRLFNQAGYPELDPGNPPRFVHPAFGNTEDENLNRLLGGLRINDEDLCALILYIAGPLAADEGDNGFDLNLENLTLLYRHARLAEWLKLTIDDLFQLIGHIPNIEEDYIANLDGLMALLAFWDWWHASAYSLDELTHLTDPDEFSIDDGIVPSILERIASERALIFADTVFSQLEEVTEAQSRAIVSANAASIQKITDSDNAYWLSADFDPDTPLVIPADENIEEIVVDETELKAVLMAYHASKVIPVYLASSIRTSLEKTEALVTMTGFDLNDSDFTEILHGAPDTTMLLNLVKGLTYLSVMFKPDRYSAEMLDFVDAHGEIFEIIDFKAINATNVQKIDLYGNFVENRPDDIDTTDLHLILSSFDTDAHQFHQEDTVQEALARFLDMEFNTFRVLQECISLPGNVLKALGKLCRCGERIQYMGVGAEALSQIVSTDYNDLVQASRAIYGSFRAKYQDEDEWQEKIAPFEEEVLNRKRNGLSDYLIHCIHPEFESLSDLYYYFLIDSEVDGCFKTSKIVAANSSLQLYVHRILMNLEQDAAGNFHVKPDWVPRHEWEWRKHYRVWEANRKVFLWPENYILPDLRDNKTPLFETLESELLQQKIDDQTVLDAYGAYIQGFEEIANLKIAGAYHDILENTDVLHLFGVTASDPPNYYYRTVENACHGAKTDSRGTVWHPWQEMDVKIPVRKVAPILYTGRLYVFWVEIVTSPQNAVAGGSSNFVGYKHKLSLKYTSLRLDGRWTVPQRISLYGFYPFEQSDGVVDDPLADPDEWSQFSAELQKLFCYGIFSAELSEAMQDLIIPRYDDRPHGKAVEGYTLKGFEWEQVYPDPGERLYGVGYQLFTRLDLFNRTSHGINDYWGDLVPKYTYPTRLELSPIPGVVLCGKEKKLYFGNGGYGCFGSYAHCTAILEESRIEKITDGWNESVLSIIRNIKDGLYTEPIANIGNQDDISVINGSLQDAIVDSNGDLLLLQGSVREGSRYLLRRLSTTLSQNVAQALFTKGVDGLLDLVTQEGLKEADQPIETVGNFIEDAVNAGRIDFTGPYGVYYREIFFHIPFLIAHHLNSQGKYAEAQKWYHYIFDPTSSELIADDPDLSEDENAARKKDRNWRYLEFRGRDIATLRAILNDPATTETYKRDPFNPHAIARLRLGAYQNCIVMKYIDNLLDWADDLFAQFQMETVNEATMLYITAADILGQRPAELGACSEGEDAQNTYDDIRPDIEEGSEFLIEMEHWSRIRGSIQFKGSQKFTYDYSVDRLHLGSSGGWQYAVMPSEAAMPAAESKPPPDNSVSTTAMAAAPAIKTRTAMTMWPFGDDQFSGSQWQVATDIENNRKVQPEFGWAIVRQLKTVFCVPHNKTMLQYWDRVEDRLYKIRNCMDITGTRRRLSLFAPEIDPGLLVSAKAAGLSLEDVLDSASGHLPPYRFSYLIAKAMNYAATVQSFGNALLNALEKKDAEELSLLRSTHEQNILKLTTKIREWDIDTARETLDSIEAQRMTVENRQNYYRSLVEEGLTDWERTQQVTRHFASASRGTEASILFLAGVAHLVAQVGSPFAMKYGGKNIGDSLGTIAFANRALADLADQISASAGLEAGFQRRAQDWQRQVDQTGDELAQIEKQIEAAKIRLKIAERSLEIHEKNREQIEEIDDFYRDKFTALGMYTWLSTELQRLYRQAYSSAYSMARLAEQAYRFERDDAATELLSHDYWDASRAGLLAGGYLLVELQNMERQYIETNYRDLEINQAFSLTQIDPAAIIRLKEDGSCAFSIPELFFNLYYPGHYRRRIKSVRLTIPCVTGPYTNVSATLTLTGSFIHKDPDLDSNLVEVPVSRTTHIATSSAQNDAGVFELNFRDERYMPFEGAGTVSSWELTLPKTFRPFDYQTISDVILHISYTAKVDGNLRDQVESLNGEMEDNLVHILKQQTLPRVFSLHHDFSNEFNRLLHSSPDQPVQIQIMDKHFPIFLKGRNIQVNKADLILGTPKDQSIEGFQINIDNSSYEATEENNVFRNDNTTYAGLWFTTLDSTFAESAFGGHAIFIANPGALTSESSLIDPKKLTDIYLYVEYGIE